jgi:hypothetical protein
MFVQFILFTSYSIEHFLKTMSPCKKFRIRWTIHNPMITNFWHGSTKAASFKKMLKLSLFFLYLTEGKKHL